MPFQLPQQVEFRPPRYLAAPEDSRRADEEPGEDGVEDGEGERPLVRAGHGTFLYPEWDFRAGAYRERWCRVAETVLEEGTSDFYVRSLAEYRSLVDDVRGRFAHLFPELFRRVPRRFDGEDFDLDSVIERLVDQRAGQTPSEKIYWRRERTQRNVAVALLIDMSATTSEPILLRPTGAAGQLPTSAEGYSAYLARIAAGVDQRGRPIRKQAIEIAKEAAVVLMQAFETIGDSYAVYGFSGSGRAAVEFAVVKDFAEQFSQRVARRIDSVQPDRATRMGAAIRHTIHKLGRAEAQTRLLVLVSDGRPYDRDYGSSADDLDYAVRDTRQALLEAARHGIRACCLTVDKSGADYLQRMCEDMPYEVVEQVQDLPMKLLSMYPRLTA
jgi:nitric oxide reductase NorD protein